MSLICAECGTTIVLSNSHEHYGICSKCPHDNETSMKIVEMSMNMFGLIVKARENWKEIYEQSYTFSNDRR